MDESYKIRLPIYEGPLDLLLDLIRKQQMNIYDIPIAKITRQYLDYVQAMEDLDISLAGEFLFMAATLIYIKSKMLLPADPLQADRDAEDPRSELVERLLEHEKFKNAAQMLHQKELVERFTWTHPGLKDFQDTSIEPELAADPFDLVSNFHKILERAKATRMMEIEREEVTISQVLQNLKEVFDKARGSVSLEDLFAAYQSRRAMVVAFIAILEMAYLQAIVLVQNQLFGDIMARRKEKFTEVMGNLDQWTGRIELAVKDRDH